MPDSPPLIAALLLDARDEFQRILQQIPPSGRNAATGPLNKPAWTIAHCISALDAWFTDIAQGRPEDVEPFVQDFRPRQAEAGSTPLEISLDEVIHVAHRVFDRVSAYLETADATELERQVFMPGRFDDMHLTVGWLVGRSVAHLFAHAGDLSVIASLHGAEDAGLPGALRNSRGVTTDAGATPLTARLLLDAREALARSIEAAPDAARDGAIESDKLNTPGFILAHLAEREDHVWRVVAQGLERDAWLEDAQVGFRSERSRPTFEDGIAAWQRATEPSNAYIESLTHDDLARPVTVYGRETTIAAQLARSAAHIWVHGGELGAIGSLAGVPDAIMPGALPRTTGP